MCRNWYYSVIAIIILALASIMLFQGCGSDTVVNQPGATNEPYQFAALHSMNDNITQALQTKGVIFINTSQELEAKYDALVVDGSQMTAAELGENETVKSYLQKNKGLLVLKATGEHKRALIEYIGMAYGTHDTGGYFVVCIPGTGGREFAIYELPRILAINAEDFQNSTNDSIEENSHYAAQTQFQEEVETKLGPAQLAENIINQLKQNRSTAQNIESQEDIPDGLKYRQWRIPNDTQYWQLNTAWLSGYPNVVWKYPAPSPAGGYQKGSFGHNTFISVYLDNRPSNGGNNYQWFSVDFQGWSEAQKPGPNSTSTSSTFKMPMNGDSHNVLDAKNFKYDGFGWAQMVYLMSFVPAPGANQGILNYQALPQTSNSSTSYTSGSNFSVGFSSAGAVSGSYVVSNTVTTQQPDWKTIVTTDLSLPSYGWKWCSNNPSYDGNSAQSMNAINLSSFQPNSSGVMITNGIISDVRTFNFSYGVNLLSTRAYYHSGGAKDHQKKDVTLNPVNLQVDIDFGAVLYPLPSQLNISPSSVQGGNSTTGTVTIDQNAPAGGTAVNLSSSNTNWATVPATVTIPEGQASAAFTITTKAVSGNSVATITANLNQINVTANVTVQAP